VRVLDLTRVIAGPVAARVLASHGADVLAVGAAHLAVIPALVIDTGFGKRSCHLDLRRPDERAALDRLAGEADVFLQGYRPGSLARRGFGADELARRHPGVVVVNVSAYGGVGPWGDRRGFDSLVQVVSGIAHTQADVAGVEGPLSLPAQALDHATGWLAALGTIQALRRRRSLGGSWAVDVSLARTAAWLDDLGRVDGGLDAADPGPDDIADLLQFTDSPFGRLTHVRAVGRLADRPVGWATPPAPPGTHPARFAERTRTP
jgi:crotonobetainyl-CoA:carnitine CoA-transferase CaiB-like acyl-CoA transferase